MLYNGEKLSSFSNIADVMNQDPLKPVGLLLLALLEFAIQYRDSRAVLNRAQQFVVSGSNMHQIIGFKTIKVPSHQGIAKSQ